jgi:hypothetical protein
VLAAAAGALAAASCTPARAFDPKLGPLLFEETFRSFAPRDERAGGRAWQTQYPNLPIDSEYARTHGAGEDQCYVDRNFRGLGLDPFHVLPEGGLEITLRPTPPQARAACFGKPFISGMITSDPLFAMDEGYWEIVARMPRSAPGLWPALWLLPADHTCPPEIDIVEVLYGRPVFTIHTAANGKPEFDPKSPRINDDLSTRDHVFGLWKDRRQVVWTLDGRVVKRAPVSADQHKPFFLLATHQISRGKARKPLAPDTRASLILRRIRAYALRAT